MIKCQKSVLFLCKGEVNCMEQSSAREAVMG